MTVAPLLWTGAVAFVGTAALTGAVRQRAQALGIIDHPNMRSSHLRATPRGGGVAIALVLSALVLLLWRLHQLGTPLSRALLGGGLAVAAIGLLDDWRGVAPGYRLLVHAVAATWALACLQGMGGAWPHAVLVVLGIVWAINLFNFMDGIDGLATMESGAVALGGFVSAWLLGHGDVALVSWLLALTCAGFLCWNWPPARIFLGDVGSGYLGYVIAVLALDDSLIQPSRLAVWVMLAGVFLIDATLTLLVRLARGERVYEAHRQHAYQRLARRWASHARVTGIILIINAIWLFPAALLATLRPQWTWELMVLALFPLVLIVSHVTRGRIAAD
jgi:Fuc2NAc and GlcNAc transferase